MEVPVQDDVGGDPADRHGKLLDRHLLRQRGRKSLQLGQGLGVLQHSLHLLKINHPYSLR
jgi:hypothetical protein